MPVSLLRLLGITLFVGLMTPTNAQNTFATFDEKRSTYAHLEEDIQLDSLINYYAYLSRRNLQKEAQRYEGQMVSYFQKEKQYLGIWKLRNHQMLTASDAKDLVKCEKYRNELLNINEAFLPESIQLQQYLNLGYVDYFADRFEEAIFFWKQGLQKCNEATAPLLQYQFYTNLGSAYFAKYFLRTATYYYLWALQIAQSNDIAHPDLYNNLGAVALKSNDISSANEYLNRIDLQSVTEPYLRVEIQANRFKTAIKSRDSQSMAQLYPWLESHINDFPPIRNYVIAALLESTMLSGLPEVKNFLAKHPEIFEVSEATLSEILPAWIAHPVFISIIDADYIRKLQNFKCQNSHNSETLNLFLAYATKNPVYWENYETLRRAHVENIDSLLIKDHLATMGSIKLEFERAELEKNLQSLEQQRLLIGTIAVVILTLLSFIIILQKRINNRKKAEFELSNELLESQSTLIDYSQSIVKKAGDWYIEIQEILQNKDIQEIKKKLNSLKRDFMILGKLNERQQLREEEKDLYKPKESSQLDRLNKTELRVAQYIMRGMRTKEISTFLELSPVYINNVRYRIRKKLEIPKELSVEEYLLNLNKEVEKPYL